MNKIYKVVWSKVKNCYVVVSEIAKNVISGSIKSAQVGARPIVKGVALGALMTFVITGNVLADNNYGIEAGNGNTIELDELKLVVTDTTDRDKDNYFAIRATENGSITVKNLNATVLGKEWSAGVEATHNAVVDLGNASLIVSDGGTAGCEAYGINVARKGNVNVDGNLIATVSGGEWANAIEAYNGSDVSIGNGSSEVTLTVVTNSDAFNDEEWGIRAHGIFAVGQFEAADDDQGVAYGGSNVRINAKNLIVKTTSNISGAQSIGIYAEDNSVVKAYGNVDVRATGHKAYGIEALNGSNIELGGDDKKVDIVAFCKGVDGQSIAVFAVGNDTEVDIIADALTINAKREEENKKTQTRRSLVARKGAVINVTANEATLIGRILVADKSEAYGNPEEVIPAVINIDANVKFDQNNPLDVSGSSRINLVGGEMSGSMNIVNANSSVNLTGATFTADNIGTAITGSGKLVVDGNGVLKTTAGQVFTVGGEDTVATDEETLNANAINAVAQNKLDFIAGSLSLSDKKYSYAYLKSITGLMVGNTTKIVMTGDLIGYDNNGEIIVNKIGVDALENLGREVELEKVTVIIDKDLQIGGANNNEEVKVVTNSISTKSLDLGNGGSVTITGDKELTLGGSEDNQKIVTSNNDTVTLVVGMDGGNEDKKGTLNIGVKEDKTYTHEGKVQVKQGSDLNTKGKTKITDGVELDGGSVNVENGQLSANLTVAGASTITGSVSGELTGSADAVIGVGAPNKTANTSFNNVKLNGATLGFDPDWSQDAGQHGIDFASGIDGSVQVARNNYVALGTNDDTAAKAMFDKTGLAFGEENINAALYIAGNQTLNNGVGSIYVDGSQVSSSFATVVAGTFSAAANSITMVDANTEIASLSGVSIANIDEAAKLYIDEAADGQTYKVLNGVDNGWKDGSILTNNQLIKFTGDTDLDGAFSVTAYLQDASKVYGSDVIIADVVDKAVSSDTLATDVFKAAVNEKVNATTAAQVDALNSIGAMNEVAGVTHTTYAVSNLLTDAVADHMSLANGKDHDKDIWAHYVHTKEDIDGLKYDAFSTQYSAQYNGIVVGSDLYKEGKATVGAALTYVDGNINGSSVAARTENDAKYYGASIYGSIQNEDTAVTADVSYLHGEHDITQRNSGNVITGEPESDAFSVGVRVEKEAEAGIGKLVPYAGLRYMHLGTGNYANSIGLAYDADDAELFLLPIGLKYSADIKNTNGWTMRPVVEFGYVWAFGDTDTNQTVSLNGVSNGFGYDVTDSGSYVGRFMLEAEKDNISYALGYEYQKGDNVKADKWMVNVNWNF